MGFVSRKYIREKWNSAKRDIDDYLAVNNETLPDQISKEEVENCIDNIKYQFKNIINELEKYNL